jgi:hypothetical protein
MRAFRWSLSLTSLSFALVTAGCSSEEVAVSSAKNASTQASRAEIAASIYQARFWRNKPQRESETTDVANVAEPTANSTTAPTTTTPAAPEPTNNALVPNPIAPPTAPVTVPPPALTTPVITPPATEPITVSAGANQTLTLPNNVILVKGTTNAKSVVWSTIPADGSIVVEAPAAINTRVKILKEGRFTLRLTATANDGSTKTSDTIITANPNPTVIGSASTPLDHLKALPRPTFKSNHSLLGLGQSHCGVNEAIDVELVRNWGYAVQADFGGQSAAIKAELKANPGKYPLAYYVTSLQPLFNNYAGTDASFPKLPLDTWLRDADGKVILDAGRPVVSPLMSELALAIMGKWVGVQMAQVEANANQPITVVYANGEHGLTTVQDKNPVGHFGRDAQVLADQQRSGMSWQDYLSMHKARHERVMKDAMFSELKLGKPIYSYYGEGYTPERGRWFGWKQWTTKWEYFLDSNLKPTVSDYSSPEMYYNFHNAGWTGYQEPTNLPYDALTTQTKNVGGGIKLGQKYILPWVSSGWDGGDSGGISDDDTYVGMLKILYTMGAKGAVAGYFTCDPSAGSPMLMMRRNLTAGTTIPTQVRGFYTLSHVQALFSHLDSLIENSDLLLAPGDHSFKIPGGEPTYDLTSIVEFPVENETTRIQGIYNQPFDIRNARVIARKVKDKDMWLVTAWANTGADRQISVTIDPALGKLNLLARRAGSVYIVEKRGSVVTTNLLDEDAMNPTAKMFP